MNVRYLNKIRKVLLKKYGPDDYLAGYCAISSYLIGLKLMEKGFPVEICVNRCHCFLRVNGNYVDVTAKQFDFGYPSVYISSEPILDDNGYGLPVHGIECSFRMDKKSDLIKIKKMFKVWPEFQNPFKNLTEIRKMAELID